MKELILWGATGQSRVIEEALDGTDFQIAALVDNRSELRTDIAAPLLHGETGLDGWLSDHGPASQFYFSVAIGGSRGRDRIMLEKLLSQKGMKPANIIHRTSFVANSAQMGINCQILALSAICASATLGNSVIVNTSASVDHDCQIGNGVHIGPGARLAGEVRIGDCAFIGTGAVILPGIKIGNDAIVGAGSVVTRNVPAGITVFGNPAQVYSQQSD